MSPAPFWYTVAVAMLIVGYLAFALVCAWSLP